jgi:N-acetylglutamate synthase-like GNAT family acetyltransferase
VTLSAHISVREARAEDAVAVIQIVRDSIMQLCVADHQNRPHLLSAWLENKTGENFVAWLNDPDNYCVVAAAGPLCGVGLLHRSGEIRLMYVSPLMQHRGVGRALLDRLESHAHTLGLTHLRLNSTASARSFYESAGYRDCNEPETWRGIVCYKYDKATSPSV